MKCGSNIAPVEFVLESKVAQAARIIPRLLFFLWVKRESVVEHGLAPS
jgi:hypothetical protein